MVLIILLTLLVVVQMITSPLTFAIIASVLSIAFLAVGLMFTLCGFLVTGDRVKESLFCPEDRPAAVMLGESGLKGFYPILVAHVGIAVWWWMLGLTLQAAAVLIFLFGVIYFVDNIHKVYQTVISDGGADH